MANIILLLLLLLFTPNGSTVHLYTKYNYYIIKALEKQRMSTSIKKILDLQHDTMRKDKTRTRTAVFTSDNEQCRIST